jgi:hypothetical protein
MTADPTGSSSPAPAPAMGPDGWFWASDAPAEGARIEMRHRADGGMDVRTSDRPDTVLSYTRSEWVAFLDGATHHEFDHLAD